jgi:Spy/CpxP family protein refolding chaperone
MKKVTILSAICFFAVSGVGLARGPMGPCKFNIPYGKWWRTSEVAKKLDLTSQEQQELDNLYVQSQWNMIEVRSNMHKQEFEVEVMLDQEKFDEFACMDRFKKYQEAKAQFMKEQFRFLVKVRKLLGLERYRELKTQSGEAVGCGAHRMKGQGQQGRKGPMQRGMSH